MSNLDELKKMKAFMQSIASTIIETQEAMEDLKDETEKSLKEASRYCFILESMIEKSIQSGGICND